MYAFLYEDYFDKHACCGKCLRSNFYVNHACIDTIRINFKKNVPCNYIPQYSVQVGSRESLRSLLSAHNCA